MPPRDDPSALPPELRSLLERLAEHDHDPKTVEQVLKAILAHGWSLRPAEPDGGPELRVDLPLEREPLPGDVTGLSRIWKARVAGELQDSLEFYRDLGQQALRVGEPLLAYDVLLEGLERWPRDLRLRQLQALALVATDRDHADVRQLGGRELVHLGGSPATDRRAM